MMRFLLFILLLCTSFSLYSQANIYSDANITFPGGTPTITNCAWGGSSLWTESYYTSVLWSTGDTTDTLILDEFTIYDTIRLWITDSAGMPDSNLIVIKEDSRSSERIIFPTGFREICQGDTIIIISGMGMDGDEIMFNTGKFCIDSYSTLCDIRVDTPGVFYFDRYRPSNGCTYKSEELEVAVTSNPAAPTGIMVDVDTLNAVGGGPVWQWYLDGSLVSGASDSAYLPVDMGTYSVQSVDTTSTGSICRSSLTDTVFIDVSFERQIENLWIKIYPNPAKERFIIRGFTQKAVIKMLDTAGREVKCVTERDGLNYIVKMEDLTPGIYLLSILDGDKKYFGKVMVNI